MTTDRPYRAGRSAEEALAELRLCAGTQFDPEVVAALAAVVARA
jgi:HD-GYP domain-containing protein (c-di-GMP phosphodiesterase class II)